MAKGKKGKKANGGFPKKVAGIRVPKAVRRIAGGAVGLLDHPLVADVIAAALFTAANRLSETPAAKKAVRKARAKAGAAAEAVDAVAAKPKRKKSAKNR